jgi:hypothetical protein
MAHRRLPQPNSGWASAADATGAGGHRATAGRRRSDSSRYMLKLMPRRRSRTAVCIVRVEAESWGLVITVTINRDVANASAEPAVRFSDTRDATAAVAEFLESFTRDQGTLKGI